MIRQKALAIALPDKDGKGNRVVPRVYTKDSTPGFVYTGNDRTKIEFHGQIAI